jgi:hypothetical protein
MFLFAHSTHRRLRADLIARIAIALIVFGIFYGSIMLTIHFPQFVLGAFLGAAAGAFWMGICAGIPREGKNG